METALYFSSFPSNISSTSVARRRVIFVAKLCGPNPTKIRIKIIKIFNKYAKFRIS